MPRINVVYRGARCLVDYDVDPPAPGEGYPFEYIIPNAVLDMSASFQGTPIELDTREITNEIASLVAQARRQRAQDDAYEAAALREEDRRCGY